MKAKKLTYLLVATAAVLGACSRIDQAELPQLRISYDVVQLRDTRAAGVYPKDRPFVSYAFLLPQGRTWADNRATDAAEYISGATVSFDGAHWYDHSQSYYWPSLGSLTFFSCSPSELKSSTTIDSSNGLTISGWDVDANQTVDIMVADVVTEQTANSSVGLYTGVPTVFRHKLSQIVSFEFNTLKDYSATTRFYVTGISLNNLVQKGTYVSGAEVGKTSVLMGKWTPDGSSTARSYNYYDGGTSGTEVVYSTTGGKRVGSGTLLILPQTFTNPGESPDWSLTPHLRIDYKVGSEAKTALFSLYELFSAEVSMNKSITIRVTFNNEGNLITWAPDQEDWTESEFSIIM